MWTDYKIIVGTTLGDLEVQVSKYIASGWQPIGGPVRVESNFLAQAMVKSNPRLVAELA